MAAEAGANVIVTACPFCMVNIEDAIKVAGLEGKMTAIDLAELVDQQMQHGEFASGRQDRGWQCQRARAMAVVARERHSQEDECGDPSLRQEEYPTRRRTKFSSTRAGNDIERDDLVYSINEPDNYAVEEALQIVARTGGNVTVATVGGEEDEEILRREMAMGANHGVLLSDEAFGGSDGKGIATVLKAFVQKGKYDLILTGVQAEDGGAQVGGMLAAMLDYPFASLVNSIEVLDGNKLKIGREIEGGNKEMNEIDLPCVLSIQTGINEPRYVGMRGIRQVASLEIPTYGAAELGVDPGRRRRSRRQGEARRLFRAGAGQGRRDSARQQRRDRRQAH